MNMLLNTPIKVLVVDDSLVFGRFLTSNLPKANSRIQIVGYAANMLYRTSFVLDNDLLFQEIRTHGDLSFSYAGLAAA